MATQSLSRLLSKHKAASSLCRRFSAASTTTGAAPASSSISRPRLPLLGSVRRVSAVPFPELRRLSLYRGLSTEAKPSDEKPKEGEKEEKKEEIMLDGCDFKHWLVLMNKPEGEPTRDEIIDSYVKTLATVVGSEEEARKKIYSVSTRCYYAFSFLGEKEQTEKINELDQVRFVVPDSYLDAKTKDYGGEPFIDGQAVPYDPKYHKDWIRNNSGAKPQSNSQGPRRNAGRPKNNVQNNQRDARSGGPQQTRENQ